MKKIEYLKAALQNEMVGDLAWVVSAFSYLTPTDPTPEEISKFKELQLILRPTGFQYFTDGKLVDIEDADKTEPLFKFKDKVEVDPSWAVNISNKLTTVIGNLIVNSFCIVPIVGDKIPFKLGKHSMSYYESYIVKRLINKDEEQSKDTFYTDDLVELQNRFQYLEEIAFLTNWSATPKTTTSPKGLSEYRDTLAKEYGDSLTDPVVYAEFENKLKKYHDDYLKDDPGYGTFVKGKVKDISLKKMYLTVGLGMKMDPNEKTVPIVSSLDEGLPMDADSMVAWANDSRAASFSRGRETINGGVSAKIVIRALGSYSVIKGDCGTTRGRVITVSENNLKQVAGRWLMKGSSLEFIDTEEKAGSYLGKAIMVRSPQYCVQASDSGKDELCSVCVGKRLEGYDMAMFVPATELTNFIMNASLKAMHGKVLSAVKIDWKKALKVK